MEGKMKVAVMLGIGKMGLEERDIPKAKDDEVLVKLDAIICARMWCSLQRLLWTAYFRNTLPTKQICVLNCRIM